MRFKRWTGYEGLAMPKGQVWQLAITRKVGPHWKDLYADKLITPDVLRRELHMGNVVATAVTFGEDGRTCLVQTMHTGFVLEEGRKIVNVLRKIYAEYEGVGIRWRQTMRQV